MYTLENVIGAAVAAQRINGEYVKYSILSSDPKFNKESNLTIMHRLLRDESPISADAFEQGQNIISYCQGLLFKCIGGTINDYSMAILKVIRSSEIDPQDKFSMSIAASIPSYYERESKKDKVESRLNSAKGVIAGSIGQKVIITVEIIKSVFSFKYNTTFVTAITTDNIPVFFGYKKSLPVSNTPIKIVGAIKAFRDGITQLNYVKVIE